MKRKADVKLRKKKTKRNKLENTDDFSPKLKKAKSNRKKKIELNSIDNTAFRFGYIGARDFFVF